MKAKKPIILVATLGGVCGVCIILFLSFIIAEKMGYIAFNHKPSAASDSAELIEEPSTEIVNSSPAPVDRETPRGDSPNPSQPGQVNMITNSIGMKLAYIPPGESVIGKNDGAWDELQVCKLEYCFWIGAYEVTQKEYQSVMGYNPSYYRGDNLPVERVGYNNAVEFCTKLSQKEGITYRLPYSSEWEYACRAGTQTRYYFGDDESLLGEYAWYDNNSDEKTHPVGQKKPNKFGLYDMHGNVWELCQGSLSPDIDNQFERGGAYDLDYYFSRSDSCLHLNSAFLPGNNQGFRVISEDFRILLKF